jgi:hypothetical protein
VHDYSVCDIFISQISCRALLLLWGVHLGDTTFNELVEKLMLSLSLHRLGVRNVDVLFHITFANTWFTKQVWIIKWLENLMLVFPSDDILHFAH